MKNIYSGAWLTDVDDTLIASGVQPDDDWISKIVDFIRVLKAGNIAWVPVSGVSIIKMGPRLLYRLPADVLSHVLYYGGEGSTKNYFDLNTDSWRSEASFQRDFTDAQAMAVIGKKRLIQYINDTSEDNEAELSQRIKETEEIDNSVGRHQLCIIDQMNEKMDVLGFDSAQSETYFRGGAVSWMMLGDQSVDYYKGAKETIARNEIAAFTRNLLDENNGFRLIGESDVAMPYPHATRGIKMVLQGNDKARAVKDMIAHHGVDPENTLFTGNELYAGGNDNSVRQVKGLNILSVGKNHDDGIINGGGDIVANQHYMDMIQKRMKAGVRWVDIIPRLQMWSDRYRIGLLLNQDIDGLTAKDDLPVSETIVTELIYDYKDLFKNTRDALTRLTKIEYDLVVRIAVLEGYHYDQARKVVLDLLTTDNASDNHHHLSYQLKKLLLPELKTLVRQLLADQLDIRRSVSKPYLRNANNAEELEKQIRAVIQTVTIQDVDTTEGYKWLRSLIKEWQGRVDKLTHEYLSSYQAWQKSQLEEVKCIAADERVASISRSFDGNELHQYIRGLLPRIETVPHLKDLDKPTLILIAGTSGVGKSMVTRRISKSLGIPTSFSTDVAARSVMRESIRYLIGDHTARKTFPELYGSSFSGKSLDWFYAHSKLTMVGVRGHIDRLIKEGISGVIEGVSLIPGTLPETYFEKANIVWVVVSVKDKQVHYERLGTRDETGVERGGSERYRSDFDVIRQNHDRLVEMAQRTDSLVVDNGGLPERVINRVLDRVIDPYADRGLPVKDKYRKRARKALKQRKTQFRLSSNAHKNSR